MLAQKFGFDADTVWQDPKNADLRAIRPSPNILFPSDVLYIPDPPARPQMTTLTPGTTNNFVAPDAPTMTLSQKFLGSDPKNYASKAYTVQELPQLTGLQTDENGVATFAGPVTLTTATVTFTATGEVWVLSLGGMDPIGTLSGIFQRLQNLGYLDADAQFDASDLNLLRMGLSNLKTSQQPTAGDAAPDPSSASSPAPASAGGASQDASSTSDAGSDAAASEAAPSSATSGIPDDAGLSDDGTLDAPTTALLLNAHGS
jgi:N-acetylmuramoyl-L-alanine amidase